MHTLYFVIFGLIGPTLPYDIQSHAMVTTTDHKVVLVGGFIGDYLSTAETQNTLFELNWKASSWKEIRLPKLKHGHLAFTANKEEKFCGN